MLQIASCSIQVWTGNMLRGTFAASSSLLRHSQPVLFGQHPQLAQEEYNAIAGVWRADLETDDGDFEFPLHLAAPSESLFGADGAQAYSDSGVAGYLHSVEDKLPPNICQGSTGLANSWWTVNRAVHAGTEGDNVLCLSMQLGNLYFEGIGERGDDFRCPAFVGTLLEGGEDPCVVGRFLLRMSLPTRSNITALEERYRERIASRPAPPLEYRRTGFVGRWRLLLSMDDDTPPIDGHMVEDKRQVAHAFFLVEMSEDGMWWSVGDKQTLAGTWGMGPVIGSERGAKADAGSRIWLSVQRSKCSETMRGVAGLPVRQDFHMAGKPVHDTRDQAEEEIEDDVQSYVRADRVDGRLWEGSVDAAYFGSFTLLREQEPSSDEIALEMSQLAKEMEKLTEACDEGFDTACDTLSKEDEAKREWLEAVELTEACDEGFETACETLSTEKEAKRAWLDKYDASELLHDAASSSSLSSSSSPTAAETDAGRSTSSVSRMDGATRDPEGPTAEVRSPADGDQMTIGDLGAAPAQEEELQLLQAALLAEQEARQAAENAANAAREAERAAKEAERAARAEITRLHDHVLSLDDEEVLASACESGHDEACLELTKSKEEEAKRVWLERLTRSAHEHGHDEEHTDIE